MHGGRVGGKGIKVLNMLYHKVYVFMIVTNYMRNTHPVKSKWLWLLLLVQSEYSWSYSSWEHWQWRWSSWS